MLLHKTVIFGGDGAVGKTTAFIYYFIGEKDPEYVPPKVETQYGPEKYTYKQTGEAVAIYYDDHEGGGEDWDTLRHLGYESAHVVVLCFSIENVSSFERIEEYWYPFTKKYCPEAKLLLLGTKTDLRNDQEMIERLAKYDESLVTYEAGKKMAEKIKAVGYYECSTKAGEGVKEVFEAAAEATYIDPNTRSRKCSIM